MIWSLAEVIQILGRIDTNCIIIKEDDPFRKNISVPAKAKQNRLLPNVLELRQWILICRKFAITSDSGIVNLQIRIRELTLRVKLVSILAYRERINDHSI